MDSQKTEVNATSSRKRIVFLGHVDHGKSTLIGRILFDKNLVDSSKLEIIQNYCIERNSEFEYAYILDAMVEERERNVTIDIARCFAKIDDDEFLFLDAPGHLEFLKNMLTGTSQADFAVLVLDVINGVQPSTHCHLQVLSFLGFNDVVVCINKMDLVDYSEVEYLRIKAECEMAVNSLSLNVRRYIPLSAKMGENVSFESEKIKWYNEGSLIYQLKNLKAKKFAFNAEFHMYVQDVYEHHKELDCKAQIIVGKVLSGELLENDRLRLFPSGTICEATKIKNCSGSSSVMRGDSISFTIENGVFASRGDLICKFNDDAPKIEDELEAKIIWLGKSNFKIGDRYQIKIATNTINFELISIENIFDLSPVEAKPHTNDLSKYQIADCKIKLEKKVAYRAENEDFKNVVIIDDSNIVGAGKILN